MKAPKDRDFTKEELQAMGIYIHPSEMESDIIYFESDDDESELADDRENA